MLVEYLIVAIMVVQLVHLSWHWYRLTGAMLADRDDRQRSDLLDWKRGGSTFRAPKRSAISRFFSR